MYGLKRMLLLEQTRLKKIEQITRDRLKDVPEGTVRISKSNGLQQFYHCTGDSTRKNGKYLHKEEVILAQKLAQKSYDEKVLHLVERRLRQINRMVGEYQDDEIERLYLKEHTVRQQMIFPVELTWHQRLEMWLQEEYEGKEFREGDSIIYSERGERVRSKSEKILADYFYHNNIPYKYEKPLKLKGIGIVYPDFTFLSKRTWEEVYWEHNGRMDDTSYAKTAIKKIQTYENNGIYVGDRLILSFETETTILSTKEIERNVKRYSLI